MRVDRNWTIKGEPAVKITCSAVIPAADWNRYVAIAIQDGWTQAEIGNYITRSGWEVFLTRWHSLGEEYDETGKQIPE